MASFSDIGEISLAIYSSYTFGWSSTAIFCSSFSAIGSGVSTRYSNAEIGSCYASLILGLALATLV